MSDTEYSLFDRDLAHQLEEALGRVAELEAEVARLQTVQESIIRTAYDRVTELQRERDEARAEVEALQGRLDVGKSELLAYKQLYGEAIDAAVVGRLPR